MIIDDWSDVVCPWCFIGRRRLQKAISQLPTGIEVTVRHRAFQLQPDAGEVMPTAQLLAQKYHIHESEVAKMQANVCAIADGEGLCYELGNTLSGNTRNAHRLIFWAEKFGRGDELLEALYSGYFEKSQPIFSDHDLLAFLAPLGLDASLAQEFLSSNEESGRVIQDQQLAQQLGANGVPFFVIDMKYGISGAQPQEVFNSTLTEAAFATSK
ncbi:MAG: DsbA family oxidoreductase, partial [Actinomycetes bacterium]